MKRLKTALIWFGLLVLMIVLLNLGGRDHDAPLISFSELTMLAEDGLIERVEVGDGDLLVYLNNSDAIYRAADIEPEQYSRLMDMGVQFVPSLEAPGFTFPTLAFVLFPIFFVVFLIWYIKRKSAGGMENILTLRKSRHQEIANQDARVTFREVGGCDEAKRILQDLVDFLKAPERWTQAGARLPRGILLEGPPGCGKTLLARAVAGETNAKFFLVSASEFVEMFVGVGAARVRDLFETAVKQAPAVIFIDELDAVGRRRGSGIGSGHDEREQTLNQLLLQLDGFQPNDRVVVIGATNRPDILDAALVRPGRFDRRIKVPPLSEDARLQILTIHTRTKPLDDGLDLRCVAGATSGFSGAQLENLTNEAALCAVRRCGRDETERVRITDDDFQQALISLTRDERRFNKLDSVLIESASQLSEPSGMAVVRVLLRDSPPVEGELIWADASFIKLRRSNGDGDLLIPKRQVLSLEALPGTETADLDDFAPDRWANASPGLA